MQLRALNLENLDHVNGPRLVTRQLLLFTIYYLPHHFPLIAGSPVIMVEGNQLNITRVSRLHMGPYLCIARNGILPTVSKRVDVKVHCEWRIEFTRILQCYWLEDKLMSNFECRYVAFKFI